jgi:hypothetical protein
MRRPLILSLKNKRSVIEGGGERVRLSLLILLGKSAYVDVSLWHH